MGKLSLKIAIFFVVVVIVYLLFVIYIVSPSIVEYLTKVDIKEAKTRLHRISYIINEKELSLKNYKEQRIDVHKKEIYEYIMTAYNILDKFNKIYDKGGISKKDLLLDSFDLISKLKHGENAIYTYILNSKGVVYYATDKKIINKNIYEKKDIKGNFFIKKSIDNALRNKEEYVDYYFKRPSSQEIFRKKIASVYFRPLDLIICSEVCSRDIKNELEVEKNKIITKLGFLIKDIKESQEGDIFIVNNSSGRVILHSEKNLLNKKLSTIYNAVGDKKLLPSLRQSYENGSLWKYTIINEDNSKAIAWIEYNKFFDWYIVSSLDKEDLKNNRQDMEDMIINISILVLIILVIIAILIIRKFLFPLTKLSKNVNLVKKGKLNIRNNFNSSGEVGNLAQHFDSMMDYIEDNTKNLENVVEKRTAELKHKLYHDELTALKNRFCLEKDLASLKFYALSLVDIKGFNEINELYGFKVGDGVLLEVAQILKNFSQKNKFGLYKLNTDIFAILDTNIKFIVSYKDILENIRQLFVKNIYIKKLQININLQVTIGTSIAQNEPIKKANIALKKAKKSKLRYLVYSSDIDTKENIKNSMYWQMKIKDAIENDNIVPFSQAIFNKNKEIVKYEALMRLYNQNSDNKYILPKYFLDIAVKTGQYFKLNQIVIKKTFDKIRTSNNGFSINISFSEIYSSDFTHFIDCQMEKLNKKQRKKIVFEILESDFIDDYKVFEDFIVKYRKKGVQIAIDDFGTGYSNFEHILKIKPDYIKIDGSLIKNIHKDKNSYEMVKSIVTFSKSLGIKNIAEFVHNEEVYNVAKSLDIDEYQGFYLGKPKLLI